MIGKALNANNDIFFEKGGIRLVEDGAEVVQHVRTRLLFYYNEWFLDRFAGTPYFQSIFVKPADLGLIESIFKTRILETPGVLQLNEFYMTYEGQSQRKLTVEFSAETIYGMINNQKVTING